MRIRWGLSTFVAVVLGLALLIPVPYLVLKPGPVFNTVGSFGGHSVLGVDVFYDHRCF